MKQKEKYPLPEDRQEEFNKKDSKLAKLIFETLLEIILSVVASLLTMKAMGAI